MKQIILAVWVFMIFWAIFFALAPVQAIEDEFNCADFGGIDVTSLFMPFVEEDEDNMELANILLGNIEFEFIMDSTVVDWDVKVFDIVDTNGVFVFFKDELCVILFMKPKGKAA